jgi:putative solute:sodium symporter small subunit
MQLQILTDAPKHGLESDGLARSPMVRALHAADAFGGQGRSFRQAEGRAMAGLDGLKRKPYWRETKSLMLLSLLMPAIGIVTLPFWIERLAPFTLFGFPLGFFLAGNGVVIAVLLIAAWFSAKQDEIDRWHGAHEDDR